MKKRRKRMIIITIISFYILTNSFIADTLLRAWEVSSSYPESTYEVGIVLGGIASFDKEQNTQNFNKYADRLIQAESLYNKGIIKKIMLSGGNGMLLDNEYNEALSMKEYLIKRNIPERDIIIEKDSRNTKENALNSSRILKKLYPEEKKILLITSAFHMRRSLLSFEKAELEVTPFSTDCTSEKDIELTYILIPSSQALEKWEILTKEIVGYIVYNVSY